MDSKIFLIFLLNLVYHLANGDVSCLDENGKPVDWFVGLKYPKGYDFVYYTSNSKDKWLTPQYDLSNDQNLLAKTIASTYRNKQNFWIYYNDESPNRVSYYYRGHLKGVVNFDKTSGYWLIHSIPRFPYSEEYRYNESESIYGQSFICVSMKFKDLSSIASQLLMMQSSVYDGYLPSTFSNNEDLMDSLKKLLGNKRKTSTSFAVINFSNKLFLHMGKSKTFNKDLYADLVAPNLQSSLYVESWIRGERVLTPCDSKYQVYNINKINLLNNEYKSSKDHSKWTYANNTEIVCIGDINRMKSQFHRGGGTMCINHKTVWNLFKNAMEYVEPCEKY